MKKLKLANGEDALVATVFDLQVAQYGIDRGLGGGNVATSYNDANVVAYTPAWAAKQTSVKGRRPGAHWPQFAENASKTRAARWSSWAPPSTTGTTTTLPTVRS